MKERGSGSVVSDSLRPYGLHSPWNSPGQNTGVDSLSLLQRIFLTQESNWGLLHCRQILYQLSYQDKVATELTECLTSELDAPHLSYIQTQGFRCPQRLRSAASVFPQGSLLKKKQLLSCWGVTEGNMKGTRRKLLPPADAFSTCGCRVWPGGDREDRQQVTPETHASSNTHAPSFRPACSQGLGASCPEHFVQSDAPPLIWGSF